jgi:hypothetical protein
LPAFVVVISLEYGHFNWGEMKSNCCFDLHLFIAKEVENFFMHLLAICTSSFEVQIYTEMLIVWGLSFLSSL